MNISVYLFGDLGSGYTQYPNDYTNTIFGTFCKNAQAETQVAIHRENDLMYYGYIRKLEKNKYIGLCVIVNGKIITKLDSLFSIFESEIEYMVRDGYLIHFNDKGNITAKVKELYQNKTEIDLITSRIQTSFDNLESAAEALPPVSYSTVKDSVKNFSVEDDMLEVVKSCYTNGYTFIYKSEGYDTANVNSYKAVLHRNDLEISELKAELSKLKSRSSSIQDSTQFAIWKTIGIVSIIILFIIILSNANKTIKHKTSTNSTTQVATKPYKPASEPITKSAAKPTSKPSVIDNEVAKKEGYKTSNNQQVADDKTNYNKDVNFSNEKDISHVNSKENEVTKKTVTDEEKNKVKRFIVGYNDAVINDGDFISYFEYDDITFFSLQHVSRNDILERLNNTKNKYKTSREYSWETLTITPQSSGSLTVIYTSDYFIHYNSRTDKYRITTEMIISPNWRIQSIKDISSKKVGSIKK